MFTRIKNRMELAAIRLQAGLLEMKDNEDGMEVIQVLVLLALGLGIIALFMTFSGQITTAVSEKIQEFLNNF